MAEPADLNVDELRRRARRRLVGAVVLALAAAVVVPMLLESDPKPLGEDVSVRIPPVDDGKFVNRLSQPQGKADAKGGLAEPGNAPPAKDSTSKDAGKDSSASSAPIEGSSASASKDVGRPPDNDASSRTAPAAADAAKSAANQNGSSAKPKYDTKLPASSATANTGIASDAASAEKRAVPAGAGAPAKSPATAAPPAGALKSAEANRTTAPKSVESAAVSTAAKTEMAKDAFSVQLAAFADDKGANSLAGKLKRAGYTSYVEPLKTSRGTLWRVRVGPFASRDAAIAVRERLKGEGQSGIVAPTH